MSLKLIFNNLLHPLVPGEQTFTVHVEDDLKVSNLYTLVSKLLGHPSGLLTISRDNMELHGEQTVRFYAVGVRELTLNLRIAKEFNIHGPRQGWIKTFQWPTYYRSSSKAPHLEEHYLFSYDVQLFGTDRWEEIMSRAPHGATVNVVVHPDYVVPVIVFTPDGKQYKHYHHDFSPKLASTTCQAFFDKANEDAEGVFRHFELDPSFHHPGMTLSEQRFINIRAKPEFAADFERGCIVFQARTFDHEGKAVATLLVHPDTTTMRDARHMLGTETGHADLLSDEHEYRNDNERVRSVVRWFDTYGFGLGTIRLRGQTVQSSDHPYESGISGGGVSLESCMNMLERGDPVSRTFADVTNDASFKTYEISTKGDPWRYISKGLNIEGVCRNQGCRANGKIVIEIRNHLGFDLHRQDLPCFCPMCHTPFTPDTCGLFSCWWRYTGQKEGGTEPVSREWREITPEMKYQHVETGTEADADPSSKMVPWTRLLIETRPLPFRSLAELRLQKPDATVLDATCPICLSRFDESDELHLTDCKHFFHADCIGIWLKTNLSCPLCRGAQTA